MFLWIFLALLAVAGAVVLWWWVRRRKIAHYYQLPIPVAWASLLSRRVTLYDRMPMALKARLVGHIRYFLDDKVFIGCDGFVVTDEVRLTIAGNACLLVLGRKGRPFPGFRTIVIYPDAFVAPEVVHDGWVVTESNSVRLGESWHRGPVVLSWRDMVERGAEGNVILHEFAHKLDEENTGMDGLPVLREASHYRDWAAVLSREYERFCHRVQRGEPTLIDPYGAESAAEFFAVISELFFQRPEVMAQEHAALYRQLSRLYRLDPAGWS